MAVIIEQKMRTRHSRLCAYFQAITATEKKKATTENARLSPCVAFPYELSNKFIEDFERIVEFIERRHIAL